MDFKNLSMAAILSIVVVFACSCESDKDELAFESLPREFLQQQWGTQEVPVAHIVRRDYRLREGDELEIIYHVKHKLSVSYKIKIEDVVEIRFPFNPAMNQVEKVTSDGTLRLDLIGAVPVFGQTIEQVRDELVRLYGIYIKNPVLTVSFRESNKKIAELKEAITTSPRGQSRLVPITPDGTISLPFIVDVRAAGKTVGELHTDLDNAYHQAGLDELEVTINVQSVAPMRVFVLGEVRSPGAVLNRSTSSASISEITLLQSIAQAGSYIPARAELSRVMVIRRRHLPRPQAAIVNVFQLLENRKRTQLLSGPVVVDSNKSRYDIWLEDGDIVYVPTTGIAKRADYIDYVWTRGIRAVGGFSSTGSYSVTDAVDWVRPNP